MQTTAATQVLQLPELVELILLSLSQISPIVVEYEDPRSEAVADRSQVLCTLLHAQRVCKTWAQTITASKALQRVLFLSADTRTDTSWDATCDVGFIVPTLIPLTYIQRSNSKQPLLNPILQHRFRPAEFRFSPPNVLVMSKRHQAHMIVRRADFMSWTTTNESKRPLIQPSWTDMQLSSPPVLEVAATVWDREHKITDSVMPPSTYYTSKRLGSETGVTMGLLLETVGSMFEKDEGLVEIKVCTA